MRLRIEHHLGMHDILCPTPQQISLHQFIKIFGLAENASTQVVQIKETLQIVKVISALDGFERLIRKGNTMFFGKIKQHLGLERAFDMQMKFRFGEGGK